jgi:acyl carrier protein
MKDSQESVEKRIKQLLISELEIDAETVAGSDSNTPLLGRGIGLDSIEALTLVVGLEQEFDIRVDDEELTTELFESIATLTEYVMQKTS